MSGEFKLVSLLNPQVVLTAGPAMSAGTQSQNTGTISFANSNGVSFGMNNGTITATVVAGAAAGIGAIGAGTNTATSGTVTFGSSAGNVTFGMNPAGYITASAPAGGGAATVFSNSNNVSFGLNGSTVTATASFPAQTAYVFSNGNGVSFGTNGSTVTATVKTDYQSAGAYLTTAMASNAGSNFVGLNSALTGNGVSATINSSGISFNVPAFLTTAAATDITTNAVALSNSSLFQHTSNNSLLQYTSATSAITSNAAPNTHTHGNIQFNLTGIGATANSASNGLTLSLSANVAGGGDGYNQAGFTNATANTTQNLVWAGNSNGSGNITFGLTGSTVTASAPAGGGGGAGLSAGTQSVSTGTVAFANSNGISFGMSGSNQITASYTVPTVPGATVFSNSNNVSFGLNGSTVTATATWPAQTMQPAVAQLNGSSGTLSIVAGSSLSASSNASTITLGLASNWSTTIMPLGNSTGYASSVLSNTFLTTAAQSGHSHGNPILALTNLTGTTASASNGFTLSLSAAAPGGGGGVAISAGSDSLFTSGTVSFGNANGFSFITSNGSIVGSYTDGGGAGGGFSAGISNLGNTANSSGTVASHIVFVGSNNITLAESVNANSATVTISGPNLNTWAIQQWPGALVGSTGSLTIISPGATTTTAGGSITTESVYLFPIVIPAQLEYNNVHVVQALAAPAAGTGSVTQIQAYALYSSNASTYSLMTDNSYVNIQYRSQNSVTAQSISMFFGTNSTTNTYTTNGNISASISGMRGASLTSGAGVSTIPAGSYLLAAAVLQSSAGGIAIQTLAHKQWIQYAFKEQPYGKAAQYQPWARHSGYITHTHSATYTPVIVFPNSFHISKISSATLGGNGVPLINFVRTDYPT